MLMLFVKWLGNLRGENRLIFGKVCCDCGRHRSIPRRHGRSLSLTLTLILRDRFAGEHDRLISRWWAVIVIATDPRGRRRPLESRIRPAASGTFAAVRAVAP